LAAADHLDREAGDQGFDRSKIDTAGFYADQLLALALNPGFGCEPHPLSVHLHFLGILAGQRSYRNG